MNTYYATKNKLAQTWDNDGERHVITILDAPDLTITQVKTRESDKYAAIQVGFGEKSTKNTTKALQGHVKVAKEAKKTFKHLKEISLEEVSDLTIGSTIELNQVIELGDIVNVTAKSKGRGFAGAIKRWGFSGGPRTHGQSDRARAVGSIGQGTDPGRVHKGKKMPGRYGNQTKTIKHLQVIHIDEKNKQLWVSGTIPGHVGSVVKLTKIRSRKFVGLPIQKEESKQEKES